MLCFHVSMLPAPAAVKYSHWDDTYQTLCSAMKEQQPDVIFGFSQGATAAALFLAALQTAQRQGQDIDVPLPKGCVVVSRGGHNSLTTMAFAVCSINGQLQSEKQQFAGWQACR